MKNDNVRNNHESQKLKNSASVMKKMAVSALLLGSCLNAQALVITAENGTVCPKEAVVLNSSLSSASSVTWQKKVNGSWVNACLLNVGDPFIYEMDDHDVEFRAVEKSGTTITAESNTIKITKGTDCVPECHSSATGDFITGTDFDPTGRNTGKLEDDVENFFGEYTLEFSKSECGYTIGGLQSSFGSYTPSIDDSVRKKTAGTYENYFMNLTNPNCNVVEIRFPANPNNCDKGFNHHGLSYRNQHYRFVMRAYVKPTCKLDGNAAFRARTGHGTVTEDRMDVELYDDVTGTLLGSQRDLQSANNVAEVKFSELTNVGSLPMTGGDYHMLRFEVIFYGYMPYVNEGLSHYIFTPEFTQFSCAKVSIDYISAEVEKVCLSPKLVCKGDVVHATATGFPKNATYRWYEYTGGEWQSVLGSSGKGDEYRTAHILVDSVGAKQYKVEINKGDGSATVSKEFTVYGKTPIDTIVPGDTIIPGDTTGIVMLESRYSSTGDLIMGTDFNPTGKNTGKLEQDVEHSFDDYSLDFSGAACSYTIGDLKSSFGSYTPSIDDSLRRDLGDEYENYFLNITNPNCNVLEIKIPANLSNGSQSLSYRGQHYRFVMRAYLTPTCMVDGNMSLNLRTGHGTMTNDQVDVELYDDVTGSLFGSIYDLQSANGVNRINFRDLMDVRNIPMSGDEYHTMRLEITFYGYLPDINNGLLYYTFSPEFSQMDCMNVSIDYVSMETENVSLSSNDAVEGDSVYATATGFPKDAKYKWYKKDGEDWIELLEVSGNGDEYRTANLQVDYGKTEYKVEVDNGDGSPVTKEFTVVGAAPQDTILPGDTTGVIMFESPNADPIVDVCTIEGFVLKTNVKLSEALVELKRGVYIIGGKKYYISK